MRRSGAILAIFGALGAQPLVAAEQKYTPPPGCDLTMTVQMRSCQVANYYRCAGDTPGDQWISYADGEGEYYLSHIDAETRWIESLDLRGGESERLDPQASADNASFSELLKRGRDDYDFVVQTRSGEVERFKGFDALTGEKRTIDGVALEVAEFALTAEDAEGNFLSGRKGRQFISREMRLFFADTEHFENSYGDQLDSTDTPMHFAFPGDRGFAATRPEYDCDMMMTDLSPLIDHPSKEALR